MADREGVVKWDHKFSPGLSENTARRWGFDPRDLGPGGILEAKVYGCAHCINTVIMNPDRERERHKCYKCSMKFICDNCYNESRLPGYVHRTRQHILECVKEAEIKGSSLGSPPKLLGLTPGSK